LPIKHGPPVTPAGDARTRSCCARDAAPPAPRPRRRSAIVSGWRPVGAVAPSRSKQCAPAEATTAAAPTPANQGNRVVRARGDQRQARRRSRPAARRASQRGRGCRGRRGTRRSRQAGGRRVREGLDGRLSAEPDPAVADVPVLAPPPRRPADACSRLRPVAVRSGRRRRTWAVQQPVVVLPRRIRRWISSRRRTRDGPLNEYNELPQRGSPQPITFQPGVHTPRRTRGAAAEPRPTSLGWVGVTDPGPVCQPLQSPAPLRRAPARGPRPLAATPQTSPGTCPATHRRSLRHTGTQRARPRLQAGSELARPDHAAAGSRCRFAGRLVRGGARERDGEAVPCEGGSALIVAAVCGDQLSHDGRPMPVRQPRGRRCRAEPVEDMQQSSGRCPARCPPPRCSRGCPAPGPYWDSHRVAGARKVPRRVAHRLPRAW